MRRALVALASAGRRAHLDRQQHFAHSVDPECDRVIVWLDEAEPDSALETGGAVVIHHPPGVHGLRLASGRNAGADAARHRGAELIVFLDADCLPHPELFERYERAAIESPEGVLCGPVTYLAEGVLPTSPRDMAPLVDPHAARPNPESGQVRRATDLEYDLFWSLSFALRPETWDRIGGFDTEFEGYGGEDTDFSYRARSNDVPIFWVGGAHALHQHHPTSAPPWQHLDDILRNGELFARRWGVWPMSGWLEAFAAAGAIRREDDGWTKSSDWSAP